MAAVQSRAMTDTTFNQYSHRVRFDWGWRGAREAAARGDAIVVVDVLRFSTTVATAAQHGAAVYPCPLDGDAAAIASRHGAVVAGRSWGDAARFSLSPSTFVDAPVGTRVVLSSLNGAMCAVAAVQAQHVFAGALVNASAVAGAVRVLLDTTALTVTVLACGERWQQALEDGALRFAVEDYLGAGAILSRVVRDLSPEAEVCAAAYSGAGARVAAIIDDCGSARELHARGLDADVRDASTVDAYDVVPVLRDTCFVRLY